LNTYIHDANLSPIWLNGPARYRVDAMDDPLTFIRWEGQPAVPWGTPEGCYMDADGNGVVNNFDFIPIKVNWMHNHGIAGKQSSEFNAHTFDVSQNYPNPFNPSTQIQYSVPERSQVRIVIMDVTGKQVAELVNRTVEEGVYTATFDATGLSSGVYLGVATMQGLESNLSFNRSIRMTLSK
jgi:Secretion system C-terminal sorting domain